MKRENLSSWKKNWLILLHLRKGTSLLDDIFMDCPGKSWLNRIWTSFSAFSTINYFCTPSVWNDWGPAPLGFISWRWAITRIWWVEAWFKPLWSTLVAMITPLPSLHGSHSTEIISGWVWGYHQDKKLRYWYWNIQVMQKSRRTDFRLPINRWTFFLFQLFFSGGGTPFGHTRYRISIFPSGPKGMAASYAGDLWPPCDVYPVPKTHLAMKKTPQKSMISPGEVPPKSTTFGWSLTRGLARWGTPRLRNDVPTQWRCPDLVLWRKKNGASAVSMDALWWSIYRLIFH